MSFELVLGIITLLAMIVVGTQLKKLNVVFTIMAVSGMVVFIGLCVTLVAAAAGVDSLLIDQTNPPW